MQSILRSISRRGVCRRHHHHESRRILSDVAAIKWVRDRGLDHAVEKESNLRPMLNLKDRIKSEPSKSLPLSIIADSRESLGIPIRPIDFIRKYPSVFEEYFPGGIGIHPHVKLTPEILNLDAEEQLIYQSETNKQQAADRLLKLLMLAGVNKIPLQIIDRLKWDLGLPQDYTETIVPEFPDYFQVTTHNGYDSLLELVCWSSDLAVSVLEKKALSREEGYEKGMPIAFPLQYSRGFEVDKKFKKWVDQWQKLPYIPPYENAFHLPAKSDEADKWVVAVLHELLHLLVPKKTDRENLLCLGEYLGLRSRFKRALLQHPGIFYLSSKIGTHTVVLRDGYKRNLLIEKHSLMDMRYKYIHLMNRMKEDKKAKPVVGGSNHQEKPTQDSKEGEEMEVDESEDEHVEESCGLSDSEVEDDSDDDNDYEEGEDRSPMSAEGNRGRTRRSSESEVRRPLRTSVAYSSDGRYSSKTRYREPTEVSRRTVANSLDGRYPSKPRQREPTEVCRRTVENSSDRRYPRKPRRRESTEVSRRVSTEVSRRTAENSSESRYPRRPRKREPSEVSGRMEIRGRTNSNGRSIGRSEFSRDRGRSNLNMRGST